MNTGIQIFAYLTSSQMEQPTKA